MPRGLSFCSICILITCGKWLHAFSEIKLDDSDKTLISNFAVNKSPMPRNRSFYRNQPNKSLYRPGYKLSEDYEQYQVSQNCHDFLTSRNIFSPSTVRLLCRIAFKNKFYWYNGMVKETKAARKRTSLSLKENKHFLLEAKKEDMKDIRSPMDKAEFLIPYSNMTNKDNVSFNDKSSSLTKKSVKETTKLIHGLQKLGRQMASMLPKSKRRSPCRIDAPLTIDENQPLPWECFQRRRWRTLHGNVYPDRLYETVCEGSCMNGHYNCTPVKYTTHVVQFCSNGQCSDERTPPVYRNVWRFLDLEVTVGCACTR